jgi:hypothetical protein
MEDFNEGDYWISGLGSISYREQSLQRSDAQKGTGAGPTNDCNGCSGG